MKWFVLMAVCVVACKGSSNNAMSASRDGVVTSAITDEPILVDTSVRFSVHVVTGRALYRIGDPPAFESEEFAVIRGGVIVAGNFAVVADHKKLRIAIIPPSGRPVRVFGRSGGGPGEFVELTALSELDDSTVGVLDNGQMRFSAIRVTGDRDAVVESERMSSQPRGLCAMANSLAAIDYNPIDHHTFRIIAKNGHKIRDIGAPLRHISDQALEVVTQGYLLCDSHLDEIAFAAITGDLFAYSTHGRLLWRRMIDDFLGVGIKIMGGGVRLTVAAPPENRETELVSFVAANDTIGILQMREVTRGSLTGADALHFGPLDSRIVDLRNGREIGRQSDLPQVVASRDSLLLVTSDEPQPWIELRPFKMVRDTQIATR